MKTSSNKFALLEPSIIEELTREVKETLATTAMLNRHKIFSSTDLWNIQRQVKQRAQRRFL